MPNMSLKRKMEPSTAAVVPDGGEEVKKKKTRKSIDLETKLEMIIQYERGKKVSMIASELGLSSSTVSTILKDRDRFHEAVRNLTPIKSTVLSKRRQGPIIEMETLLMLWIEERMQKRLPLTFKQIQTEAISLLKSIQEASGQQCTDIFRASNGWFLRFKKRFGLQDLQIFGKTAYGDVEADSSQMEADDAERCARSRSADDTEAEVLQPESTEGVMVDDEIERDQVVEKTFTGSGLAFAFSMLEQTVSIFESMDPNQQRFADFKRQIDETVHCYRQIFEDHFKKCNINECKTQ